MSGTNADVIDICLFSYSEDISESNCTAAGCIWSLYANGVPSCYLPDSNNYGYQVAFLIQYSKLNLNREYQYQVHSRPSVNLKM